MVGGVVGAVSGRSKRTRRRNAVIGAVLGAAIGAAIGAAGRSKGMEYTVEVGDGTSILVVSDQLEIRVGDCVSVEETGDIANIRRQSPVACEPAASEAMADVEGELVDYADECAEVRQQLLVAQTAQEVELAAAKARILCE